jgi:outer membrane protein OmpA-like peptidoglycan-associated protein
VDIFHPIVGYALDGLKFVRTEVLDLLGPSGAIVVLVGQLLLTGGILISFFAGKTLWAPPTPALKDFGPRLVAGIVGFGVFALMIWLYQDPTAPAFRFAIQLIATGIVGAFVYLFAYSTQTFVCEFETTLRVKGLWRRREARLRMHGQETGIKEYDMVQVQRNTALFFCGSKSDPEFVWSMKSQAAAQLLLLAIYVVFMGSFVLSLACVAMAFQHKDITETPTTVELNIPTDVLFGFDERVLRPDATDVLRMTAHRLRNSGITGARIQGHTDAIGTAEYNAELSTDRAEAVRKWLTTTGGLSNVAFTIEAMGSTQPVAPDKNPDGSDNPSGRALNRRVTIVIDR